MCGRGAIGSRAKTRRRPRSGEPPRVARGTSGGEGGRPRRGRRDPRLGVRGAGARARGAGGRARAREGAAQEGLYAPRRGDSGGEGCSPWSSSPSPGGREGGPREGEPGKRESRRKDR
ncbi:uncharacterized protein MICPUCDRAFT_66040 [Micromonas pusilla CCMP1545]|uniref:Predicted protein n=1 Tax=Micromonas pusilla (strain CCMP1545) TaxID=564608 RepID=C1NAE9_MICPC|nr:uncharacterized protein MICPUCDRAFT_66040 [Micromonas pusilla CCMP1545]EEH50873.1 predicted protein [Micromonas pusilla CCMP1545]|eukprot:XP_003064893.1 predicted protein [Micromonas pusilla CCMP1545]